MKLGPSDCNKERKWCGVTFHLRFRSLVKGLGGHYGQHNSKHRREHSIFYGGSLIIIAEF